MPSWARPFPPADGKSTEGSYSVCRRTTGPIRNTRYKIKMRETPNVKYKTTEKHEKHEKTKNEKMKK